MFLSPLMQIRNSCYALCELELALTTSPSAAIDFPEEAGDSPLYVSGRAGGGHIREGAGEGLTSLQSFLEVFTLSPLQSVRLPAVESVH